MSMSVELPDGLAAKVATEASKRGVTPDAIVVEAVEHALAPPSSHAISGGRRRLALSGIGSSTFGLSDRIDELMAEGFGRD